LFLLISFILRGSDEADDYNLFDGNLRQKENLQDKKQLPIADYFGERKKPKKSTRNRPPKRKATQAKQK
jgi:hypothetical protein